MAKSGKNEIQTQKTVDTNPVSNGYKELKPEELRWRCPESMFNFKTTAEVDPLDNIVGQKRAIEAIRLGAELNSTGYNIFVSGLSGTGRLSTVQRILEEVTTTCPLTYDFCYVNNFNDPDSPRLVVLPRKKGTEFSNLMNDAITYLRRRLPMMFEDEGFLSSRRKIIEEFQEKERGLLKNFDDQIRPYGFIRGQLENDQGVNQPEIFPLIENQPVPIDALEEKVAAGKITKEQAEEFSKLYQKFHNELFDIAREGMIMRQEFRKNITENDKAGSLLVVSSALDSIKDNFKNEKVDVYIDECKKYILDNLSLFVPMNTSPIPVNDATDDPKESDGFNEFKVNIVLDNSNTIAAPIITETTPSYTNLFGTVERTYDNRGFWKTDFTKIKAGSLLKADQGYLIVNALDLFTEPGVWPALKRVLLYNKLEMQPYEAYFQLSQLHLKPESINVNVKVIIIGGGTLYRTLYQYEKGFKKIFKINAQFDYETEKTDEMINNYARFISKICRQDNITHCTPDGVAAIIEWAVEKAGSQKRITLKFSDVADILREAAFYDRSSTIKYINRDDVENAVKWRRYRNDMLDEKLTKSIIDGVMMINTEGERVGQINGLTVLNDGILSFGKPARITATISTGNAGIINIEREVDMSGAIHNKGVLILSSFLREKFGKQKPMNLSASLAFEQSYSGIDGDSATAAEMFTILSAIAEVPIKQTLAITGSMNQKGDIQPIGGVIEKITGFYEICKQRGLTGEHGVIIPEQNVSDLMLNDDIINDVRDNKFHIYSFSRIEDAIELLMGLKPGERNTKGQYPAGTLFYLVEKNIDKLRKNLKSEEAENKKKKTPAKKTSKKTKPIY